MDMRHGALAMDFPDEKSARLAEETFDELGYDPVRRDGRRVYIHVRNEDLISALEIMEACGGCLTPAGREAADLADRAYGMEEIPIPAHTVNEDWTDAYADGRSEASVAKADGRAQMRSAHADSRAEAQGARVDGRAGTRGAHMSGRADPHAARAEGLAEEQRAIANGSSEAKDAHAEIRPEMLAMVRAQNARKPHHGEEPLHS